MNSAVKQLPPVDRVQSALAPDSHRVTTILSIQVLRFVAAIAVTLFHAHSAVLVRQGVPSEIAYGGHWHLGASGVHIFFVISGFVMVLTSFREGRPIAPRTFLQRRFLRIYPIYWIMASVYLAAHWLMGTAYILTPGEIVGAYWLYSDSAARIIGPGWTLAYEVYFYLCFAIGLLLGMTRGLVALTAFFVVSVAAGMAAPAIRTTFPLASNGLLLEFILGCWIGYVALRSRDLLSRVGWPGMVVGTALLIGSNFLTIKLPTVIAWGIPSVLVVAGAVSIEKRFRGPVMRKVALLGDSSYLLYLSHILLLDVFALFLLPASGMSYAGIVIATIAFSLACVVVSHAAHLIVEAPMLRLLNHFLKSKRGTTPIPRSA